MAPVRRVLYPTFIALWILFILSPKVKNYPSRLREGNFRKKREGRCFGWREGVDTSGKAESLAKIRGGKGFPKEVQQVCLSIAREDKNGRCFGRAGGGAEGRSFGMGDIDTCPSGKDGLIEEMGWGKGVPKV
eukprot:1361436-Amorphochlora_amoeboformis.AAC.2